MAPLRHDFGRTTARTSSREQRHARERNAMRNNKSIPARARSEGFAPRTLYTEIEQGRGPVVTQVSPRRKIIEDEHWEAWLAARRKYPPGQKPVDAPQADPRALPPAD
jgi:hypothetical protein